jgi:transposase
MRTRSWDVSVFKEQGAFRALRASARVHGYLVTDCTRAKNRLKAMFRSLGVGTPGDEVYNPGKWTTYEEMLPPHARAPARRLLDQAVALMELKLEAQQEMVAHARKHAAYKQLLTCPGMGPVRVAQAMAVVVTPERFRTRRQFWSYCGLGIRTESSSDWVKQAGQWSRVKLDRTRGLNKQCNKQLKMIFVGAATTIMANVSRDDPMRVHYEKMVDGNIKPNLARMTVARQVASVFLRMWKSNQPYDPARLCTQTTTTT